MHTFLFFHQEYKYQFPHLRLVLDFFLYVLSLSLLSPCVYPALEFPCHTFAKTTACVTGRKLLVVQIRIQNSVVYSDRLPLIPTKRNEQLH